jgi:carbon storage regulator
MLVLSRKPGERVCVGRDITFTVVEIHGDRVRIAVSAPQDVTILRGELQTRVASGDQLQQSVER